MWRQDCSVGADALKTYDDNQLLASIAPFAVSALQSPPHQPPYPDPLCSDSVEPATPQHTQDASPVRCLISHQRHMPDLKPGAHMPDPPDLKPGARDWAAASWGCADSSGFMLTTLQMLRRALKPSAHRFALRAPVPSPCPNPAPWKPRGPQSEHPTTAVYNAQRQRAQPGLQLRSKRLTWVARRLRVRGAALAPGGAAARAALHGAAVGLLDLPPRVRCGARPTPPRPLGRSANLGPAHAAPAPPTEADERTGRPPMPARREPALSASWRPCHARGVARSPRRRASCDGDAWSGLLSQGHRTCRAECGMPESLTRPRSVRRSHRDGRGVERGRARRRRGAGGAAAPRHPAAHRGARAPPPGIAVGPLSRVAASSRAEPAAQQQRSARCSWHCRLGAGLSLQQLKGVRLREGEWQAAQRGRGSPAQRGRAACRGEGAKARAGASRGRGIRVTWSLQLALRDPAPASISSLHARPAALRLRNPPPPCPPSAPNRRAGLGLQPHVPRRLG